MNINIENPAKERFDFRGYKKLIEQVIQTVETEKNLPEGLEVNVVITDDKEIKRINRETRGINKATDVLSFPYFTFKKPGVLKSDLVTDPESILGDIIICAGKIKSQAKQYGHTQKRELAYLTLHSMLHLVGYDHEKEKDEILMNKEAERIMGILGIDR